MNVSEENLNTSSNKILQQFQYPLIKIINETFFNYITMQSFAAEISK